MLQKLWCVLFYHVDTLFPEDRNRKRTLLTQERRMHFQLESENCITESCIVCTRMTHTLGPAIFCGTFAGGWQHVSLVHDERFVADVCFACLQLGSLKPASGQEACQSEKQDHTRATRSRHKYHSNN